MRIVVDENIPMVEETFGQWGTLVRLPGYAITPQMVKDADALIVRSVTPVNEPLLANSKVAFVGSATSGIDHVDLEYLRQQGIFFAHAPGSNAWAVVEYVLLALWALAVRQKRHLQDLTIGIVGCGQIGSRLAKVLKSLGMKILQNDPPRARLAESQGEEHAFVTLEQVLKEADIITLHVPLTTNGEDATYHLISHEALASLKPQAWLFNASRGAVVDNVALKQFLKRRADVQVVLDVWEQEPAIDVELLSQVTLGTPHIAGYSYDAKLQGTWQVYQAFCTYLGTAPPANFPVEVPNFGLEWSSAKGNLYEAMYDLLQQVYDIERDDQHLRQIINLSPDERAAYFQALRKHYPLRWGFRRYQIRAPQIPNAWKGFLQAMGFQVMD